MNATSSSSPFSADAFYATAPLEGSLLYQGEILVDTPIFAMPEPTRWLILRTQSLKRVDEALDYGAAGKENRVRVLDSNQFPVEWQKSGKGDFVMGILDKTPSLVVSQNCDIATKEYIQIAPIQFPEKADEEYVDRLRSGGIMDNFYLPPHPPEWTGDAFAVLSLMQSVHKSYIKGISDQNHFRLSTPNVLKLQQFLTRYFGRPNAYDVNTDIVPRDGVYLCRDCFYGDGVATAESLTIGSQFHVCARCEGVSWLPKLKSVPGS